MTQKEYKLVPYIGEPSLTEKELNKLGLEHFEIVSHIGDDFLVLARDLQ